MNERLRTSMDRRTLLRGAVAGAAAACLPTCASGPAQRRHLVGHTGITWGYAPEYAEQAIADVASLGFHGFESFGSVLEYWESHGGLGTLLDATGLPLIGAYCPMILTAPAQRQDEVDKIVRWGKLINKYGGQVAVIGPDNVDRASYDFSSVRSDIIATLDEIGAALEGLGLVGALHQHTGSCIMTRDETYAVMDAVNTERVKLCPDTGELLAAGLDPVQVVKDFLPIVAHVHIKDFNAGEYNDGYCPVGTGRVDVAGVIDVLESSDADFMIMAELNPNGDDEPAPPLELARTSRQRFIELGYRFGPR